MQLPPLFNMPKSQLQLYGEGVYCIGEDYLSKCAKAKSSLERFTSVVAWSISTTRPAIFGFAPFNPILGETHHVSKGTLNVLLEQVILIDSISQLHAMIVKKIEKNILHGITNEREKSIKHHSRILSSQRETVTFTWYQRNDITLVLLWMNVCKS